MTLALAAALTVTWTYILICWWEHSIEVSEYQSKIIRLEQRLKQRAEIELRRLQDLKDWKDGWGK